MVIIGDSLPGCMGELYERPSVAVELARRMGFEPFEDDCVVVYVQLLSCANSSKASANIFAQADGDRRRAPKVTVSMGCTNGVVVDVERGETDVLQLLVGTHLIHNCF